MDDLDEHSEARGSGRSPLDFQFSLAVSALVIIFIMFSGVGGGITMQFSLALLALSQVGFFALSAFKKAGVAHPNAEYLFIGTAAACYIVAAFALGTFSAVLPFAFVALVLCAPAIGGLVKGVISSG